MPDGPQKPRLTNGAFLCLSREGAKGGRRPVPELYPRVGWVACVTRRRTIRIEPQAKPVVPVRGCASQASECPLHDPSHVTGACDLALDDRFAKAQPGSSSARPARKPLMSEHWILWVSLRAFDPTPRQDRERSASSLMGPGKHRRMQQTAAPEERSLGRAACGVLRPTNGEHRLHRDP